VPDPTPLATRVGELFWYHRLELPGGVVTPGHSSPPRTSPLPERLDGRSVLDIGTWDGLHAFEAARRGARRVLATDSFVWRSDRFSQNRPFLLAREALGLEGVVDDRLVDVMDLSPEALGGTFDVVLLLGVLYHLTDPVTAVERAASVCDELLVVETETALNWLPYPASRVYPGSELAEDDTNWFALNVRALRGLLARAGFTDVVVVHRSSLLRRVVRAVRARRDGGSFRRQLLSQRVVLHARR
jgi:tRNA (mo5U34)-methyltransferase